ncbi:hypothetical protein GCM10022199_03500 [Marihabitans asiaticum]|uniref:SRPBCC family protein n=1 Tax=Marihabitans asiaticum TaxID=415218 RepID=UPI001FE8D04F|nr:SRPBCC family protein [Marihabitans asiaticum]
MYRLVDTLREWEHWSPWEDADPNMEHTYTGPERGVGCTQAWSGNKEAGEGAMEITSSSEDGVTIDLRFVKPFKAHNQVRIDLDEVASTTAGGAARGVRGWGRSVRSARRSTAS